MVKITWGNLLSDVVVCNRNQSNILGYVTVSNYLYPGVHRLLSD